ncbi:MAG: OprD family outer membrane porin [Saprospiraceae bacterium]|nr:OprD family porin [Saprospiraceae bacterium]MDW8229022.1 OprD family outer membrane porin [Saprospiraceae bacterium]
MLDFFVFKRTVLWLGLILGPLNLPARPMLRDTAAQPEERLPEVRTLLQAFQKGQHGGQFRTFVMVTDNTGQLSDYYAWAAGGWLHFQSAPWHGFSMGVGGAFNFNLLSSDLSLRDSATGAINRYEIGLFDVENPRNRRDLDRLEELWLRYQWRNSRITVGQQLLQTPLINHQDGRMRPTAEAGAWLEWNEWRRVKIEGGLLWRMSPRSTVRWYTIGESIGLYPRGINPDGSASGYSGNLKSGGVGLVGITWRPDERLTLQLWDQYVERIFNTALLRADYQRPVGGKHRLLAGLMLIRQDAVAHGGNEDPAKAYFPASGQSVAFSTQMGWQRGPWRALAAYTRVTAHGRFLSPREWGREPFYTFMPRERIEGSGDSHSITGRILWSSPNSRWQMEGAYGHFYLPDIKNTALNKYGFPAFRQLNLDVRYSFGGALEGLRGQLLYVWKGRIGEFYGNYRHVINKVDMTHVSLVLNYTF